MHFELFGKILSVCMQYFTVGLLTTRVQFKEIFVYLFQVGTTTKIHVTKNVHCQQPTQHNTSDETYFLLSKTTLTTWKTNSACVTV